MLGIIPLLLLLFWLTLSLFFTSKYSFSVIYSAYNKGNFVSLKTDELLAKQKVSAEFRAKEDNLGIVSVRFYNFQRISNDVVVFRIKEKSQKEWFYENKYKVDQFQSNDFFTFGFPIIDNSKDKTYYFEIQSTAGMKGDAIAISEMFPIFITQYQFTKQQLFANKMMIPIFLTKKIFYSFSDINFFISSLVYLLPFIFYIAWYYLMRRFIRISFKPFLNISVGNSNTPLGNYGRKKYMLFYIYIVVVLMLIFFMNVANDYVYLMLIGLWTVLVFIYKFDSSVSYLLGLFSLLLCSALLILNQNAIAENAAIWVYFFLVIGTIEAIVENIKNFKNMTSYDVFLKENFIVSRGKKAK